jgi:AcrR family transcriptional regulator
VLASPVVPESTRLALRIRPKQRRSHAERTAETRAKIITGVIDSIGELGLQRTTATEIARRAGVTWGAVQHHFGGKDGILAAVLEDSFNRFAARLDDIPTSGTTLSERASLFVDRAWAHFSSRHYRTAFEILLSYLGREGLRPTGTWREEMWRAWDAVWERLFWDSSLPRRRSLMLQHYTVSVLSGLASTVMLQGAGAALPRRELALLKETLAREMAGGAG